MSIGDTIEQLARKHGSVYVSKTYIDGLLSVTAFPNRECLLDEDGYIVKERLNWTINWAEGLDKQ